RAAQRQRSARRSLPGSREAAPAVDCALPPHPRGRADAGRGALIAIFFRRVARARAGFERRRCGAGPGAHVTDRLAALLTDPTRAAEVPVAEVPVLLDAVSAQAARLDVV